ncbi:hypothetical protein CI109_105510 [Kwoniella shandongensis]|uniref:DASH complex subunit ASK1 n=1 Tax=Kwoniella shandongensis TaxID=1734106 RepID=A0A5M6C2I9_9TREE|nr:uncharacterized protein CI109_002231 [Kwoniella shandongensis]KAA5529338.1 hypothetical protein CI109_002231 [Kwoniella shandongensis]
MSSNANGNPLLQPPFYVIPGIDPNAPISAQTEQIDQLNTLLLQEIDANFAKFHQIVTSRVLPEIKRFAIAGEPTREAAQFWRSFFTAASAIRYPGTGDTSVSDQQHDTSTQYDDQTLTLRRDADESSIQHHDEGSFMFDPPPGTSSTPLPAGRGRLNDSWEDSMESPFDRLDRKLRDELKIGKETELNYAEQSSSDMPTPSLPSGYSLPRMEEDGSQFSSFHEGHSTGTVGMDPPSFTGTVDPRRPSSATPKANRTAPSSSSSSSLAAANPFGANFNGIADLRSTPLNVKSKSGRTNGVKYNKPKPKTSILPGIDDEDDSDDELKFGMSPPVTMNFTLPPRAQAVMNTAKAKTPAKPTRTASGSGGGGGSNNKDEGEKQAKFIIDDLLEQMGSDISPGLETPEGLRRYSIMPNELQPGEGKLLFSSERSHQQQQPIHEEEEEDETYHGGAGAGVPPPGGVGSQGQGRRSLAANTSYGSDTVELPAGQVIYSAAGEDEEDDSFDDEGDTFDTNGYMSSQQQQQPGSTTSATGPLYGGAPMGMGMESGSSAPYSATTNVQHLVGPDDSYLSSEDGDYSTTSEAGAIFGGQKAHQSLGGGMGRKSEFNLMKKEDMDTYHGGKLLDAAGNEMDSSPTNALRRLGGGGQ